MPLNLKTGAAGVAVIGGGAAGLLAGVAAVRAGARAVVYERMPSAGRKLAIAGGGRCNFTNTLRTREFVRRFGDKNAPKLGHALRAFSNEDTVALLARHGVEGQVEHDYRVFTKSGRGGDVVRALAAELQEAGGELECGARIQVVRCAEGHFILEGQFTGREQRREARAVLICTGGLSYPATGSSGDGYALARALGHSITPLRAALVGLAVEEAWAVGLQGLSWQDAEVTLRPCSADFQPAVSRASSPQTLVEPAGRPQHCQPRRLEVGDTAGWKPALQPAGRMPAPQAGWKPALLPAGKMPAPQAGWKPALLPAGRLPAPQFERGEILFTHFGISGPAILDLSNVFVASGLPRAALELDFFPDIPGAELDKQLLQRFKQFPNRTLAHAFEGFVRPIPARLLEYWREAVGPAGVLPLCRFPKEARLKLRALMKASVLTVTGTRGVEHGEVTAGGVAWEELEPATLESRLCPGLFFAGEILDVAGRCGGFNLQAAFSTGFLAGQNAARVALAW